MKKFPFLKEVNVLLGIKILIVQNNMYKKKVKIQDNYIGIFFTIELALSTKE